MKRQTFEEGVLRSLLRRVTQESQARQESGRRWLERLEMIRDSLTDEIDRIRENLDEQERLGLNI